MNVRAERLMWQELPEDEWLTQEQVRQVLRERCGFRDALPGAADAAIGWLAEGGYVTVRNAAPYRPLRAAFIVGTPPDPPRPRWEYRRNPLSNVPLEADLQRMAADLARGAAEAKAARKAALAAQLRELGLDVVTTTTQEA